MLGRGTLTVSAFSLSFPDSTIFILHEKDNILSAQEIKPGYVVPTIRPLANVSILPDYATTGTQFAAGELLVSPTAMYMSYRKIGVTDTDGDGIAIIKYKTQDPTPGSWYKLSVQWWVPTGLHGISGMAFSDDWKYLVAGGGVSGGVKVFQVNERGFLTEVANSSIVDTRTSFVWR
jgi:hypothetical protein